MRTTDITPGSINWGSVPFCDLSSGELDKYLLHDGDVVISRAGSVGYSFLLRNPQRSVFTSYLIRFRPCINAEFFNYFLHTPTYWNVIGERSLGIAVQNVNASTLSEIQLPIPPAAEQTRIVEKLEELLSDLDAGVAELKAAQKKLAQYRQSLLKAAVEGALTAEWRKAQAAAPAESGTALLARILTERRSRWASRQLAKFKAQGKAPPKDWQGKYPEPAAPDIAGLPELPEGWVWASLDQCSLDEQAITDGPFGSNLKSLHYQENGPRVVRLKNIGEGVFVNADAHISQEHFELLGKHAVIWQDLLVAMLGEVLPRACIARADISPAIVKADCACIRINQELISPLILNAVLNAKPTRDRVAGLVKGIGRPCINWRHVRSIAIAVSSRKEQVQIELILHDGMESIARQLDAIQISLKQSAAQRKNILQAAFSGQLVPQDPTDEPASALQARIRAEREERASSAKAEKSKPSSKRSSSC